MSNKKKQVSVEDIVKDVCDILDNIISDNTDYFEEEENFKVRPGYG